MGKFVSEGLHNSLIEKQKQIITLLNQELYLLSYGHSSELTKLRDEKKMLENEIKSLEKEIFGVN